MSREPGVYPIIRDGGLGLQGVTGDGVRAIVGVSSKGTANQAHLLSDVRKVETVLGRGPLADAVSEQLSLGGGSVYAVPVAGSIAGTITANSANPGSPAVGLTGTVTADLDVIVEIVKAGALGTAEFTLSLDGGDTVSPRIATSASYTLPGLGHAITFATGNYVLGATYAFRVAAPKASNEDITTAVRALLDGPLYFEYVHVAQDGDQGLWTIADTLALEAEANGRYLYFITQAFPADAGESVDAWVARLLAAYALFPAASKRVVVVAAVAEVNDPQTGRYPSRNLAARLGARLSRYPIHESPAWVERGPIPGAVVATPFVSGVFGKSSSFTNAHATALNDAGFTTAYTIRRRTGLYWYEGRVAAPATSDFSILPYRRVMDQACTLVSDDLVNGVQEGIDPANLEASVAHRVAKASAVLNRMKGAGSISSGAVVLPPGQDVLGSRKLIVQVRVTPLGYPREIVLDIGLQNPFLTPPVTATPEVPEPTV